MAQKRLKWLKIEFMAKKSRVSEEYIQEVLKKCDVERLKEARKRQHKQAVDAGKELILLCLWMQAVGTGFQSDLEMDIADFLKAYPEALKEVLAYYNKVKEAPALGKALLKGFSPSLVEGKLMINFFWHSLPDSKLELAVKALKDAGKA